MLCKRDDLCAFPSGIALGKNLPVNLVGVDYCIYWCCFRDRSGDGEHFPCRQILLQGPEAISGLGSTPGLAVSLRLGKIQWTYLSTMAFCSRGAVTSIHFKPVLF